MSNTSLRPDGAEGNGFESTARGRLHEKHLADLRASGLSWETIVRGEFRTETDPEIIGRLLVRRDAARLGPCLLLPYVDLDGKPIAGYVRAKPDNPPASRTEGSKTAKYLTPAKFRVRAYFPPGAGEVIRNADRPVVLTEGEKKAAAVWQTGMAVIGLAGVECWSHARPRADDGRARRPRQLLDDLAGLPWSGRTVYVAFDSDIAEKPGVRRAEASLARALANRGAIVKLVRIPAPADGSKLGIDDYLVRQPDPAAALQTLFTQAVEFADAARHQVAGSYRVQDGRIVRDVWTRDGLVETPLSNFDARIVDELVRDDGSGETTHIYGIEGRLAVGPPLSRVSVPADRFAAMGWPAENWGSRAIVNAGQGCKDHLRAAIQSLSDAPRRTVYTHVGWREIDGAWHYLHAGGAIGPAGSAPSVCCDPPQSLRLFVLSDPPIGDRLRAAVRASLGLLDGRVQDRVAFSLIAAAYRAPLGSADFAAFFAGLTGVFKSELAALGQQHFGPGMDARHLPANWASTGNALEGIAFAAKDALLVVDDFAPSGTSADVQRTHREAERLLRAQGNNAGRHRMASDASLRAERPPRGLVLATGEDVPRGESIRARLAVVEVSMGDVPTGALTEFQRAAAAGEYSSAMAGYIRFLATDYARVQGRLMGERAALRDGFAEPGMHARTPAAFADLALGLRYLLAFAENCGAVTPAERDVLWARGRTAFGQLSREQADHIAAADPVDLYLRLVRAALASGRAHVADRTGAAPAERPESWGWRSRLTGGVELRRPEWQPLGHRVGWVDGSSVYLEPEGAFAEAQRLAAEQGQAIPLSARTLHRRLNERGLLARVEQSGGKTRFCVRAVLEGQRREVLCFSAATLFPPEGAAIAPRPASAAWSGDRSGDTLDGECDSPSQSCATLARPRVRPNGHRENAERDPEMAHSAHCLNGEVSAGAGAE